MSAFSDARVEFVVSSGGNFIVEMDSQVIYSKKDLIGCDSQRFPHIGEVASLAQDKLNSQK